MPKAAVAPAPDPKHPYDLGVEPKNKEEWARAEVWLEHLLIKEIGPEYESHNKALAATRDKYAYHLACWKATVVRPGRAGSWKSSLEKKFPHLNIRTVDRWIDAEIKNATLPPWVEKQLLATKKDDDEPIYKVSITLQFDTEAERDEFEDAQKRIGKRLTNLLLEAVREDLALDTPASKDEMEQ
jgi:hypothetical protein